MTGSNPPAPSPATHSHTLDRGLRALRLLAQHPDGLSVTELADLLETHRAAVYRVLDPLAEHHLARRGSDGRITLAAGLIELAAAVKPRLQAVAEPVLQRLADRLRATTALTIRDGEEAVVALVLAPREPRMHLSYPIGLRHPLTHGCPGHVLLAAAAPQPGEPRVVTRARAQGYGISRGELLPGATGVAAAIAAPGHEPEASISAVWIEGLEPHAVAADVVAAAREVAAGLRR